MSTQILPPNTRVEETGNDEATSNGEGARGGNGFADRKRPDFHVIQPATTYTGAAITPLPRGLPKQVQTLCPECTKIIPGRQFEQNGKVYMEKTCSEHGDFRDVVFSDARLYLKMEEWTFGDNRGVSNPAVANATTCPTDCGLCSMHASHTGLANVDLTNRCNLTCPVCFANANVQGYLYEPSLEEVRVMLQALRDVKPVNGRVVQFSGGEPTMHPRWFEVVAMARDMGFSHIQAATNGINFANLEFALKSKEAGLHTLYLQFDGISDDVYTRTRGQRLAETKFRAIENCRKADLHIVFVPTIVKGINDHQIGDIVRVAIENCDIISGISFQPVAFTGRINRRELERKRFTLADLAHAVSEQTGLTDAYEDWFPLACVTPFSRLVEALRGKEMPTMSCHPHCSLGTYLYVDEETKEAVPVTRFMDVGAMLQDLDELARKQRPSFFKYFTGVQAWNSVRKHFKQDRAPRNLTFERFLKSLQGMTDKEIGRTSGSHERTYRAILVAGMHFMDAYNYDVERVKRCLIHYAAPDGQLYPFCTYNSGPCFRERVERKFSVPWDPKTGVVKNEGTN